MSQPAIRLDVITLICDSNFKYRTETNTWSHREGRPFTKEEQKTALSCTRYEFEIAAAQIKREIAYRRERAELPDTLYALLSPYFAQLPTGSTVSDVEPLMTDEDRTEYERLRDLVAPDGYLLVSDED
ncbi:hypothetical protein [Streptomyces sp. NPDC048473]|uniref:hypothetical protein n=1 Tax=unclassified Streptomyces TaxID=2593676 RepID=UPI003713AB4B